MKRKILICIESDICTRHFVFSGVFKRLIKENNVVFVYPPKDWKRTLLNLDEIELGAPYRQVSIPERRIWLWRRLVQVHEMMWKPGKDLRERRRKNRSVFHWKQVVQLTVYGLPGIYQLFRLNLAFSLKAVPCTNFQNLLDDEKPDAVLHPSTFDGYFINDMVTECKRRNIPSVLIMNSWDNPSLKQTAAEKPDWCVVWGDQTANHTHRYMNFPRERIIKAGAAQFEIYKQPPSMDREEFCKEHGIAIDKKIILYAGSNKRNDEYRHLELLNEACEYGPLKGCVVLYRPHPWGECGGQAERIYNNSWSNVYIEKSMVDYVRRVADGDLSMFIQASYARTHDVLSHIDIAISPLSTIIIEAAVHNKPPLAFVPLDEEERGSLFEVFSTLVHFKEMFDSKIFATAYSEDDLIKMSASLILKSEDQQYIQDIHNGTKFFIEPSNKPYGDTICDIVDHVCKK